MTDDAFHPDLDPLDPAAWRRAQFAHQVHEFIDSMAIEPGALDVTGWVLAAEVGPVEGGQRQVIMVPYDDFAVPHVAGILEKAHKLTDGPGCGGCCGR